MKSWLVLAIAVTTGCSDSGPPAPQPEAPPAVAEVAWGLDVSSIRFDEATQTLFVQAALASTPDDAVRGEPVYVGVTAVTTDQREIDLMVHTLFPGGLDAPVLFSAEIGADVESVLIGAWDRKIAPCEVDRYGCREFGFVLDGSLATWPPELYTRGIRQRIPPSRLSLAVRGSEELEQAAARLLGVELAVFGARVGAAEASADGVADAGGGPAVRYANAKDALIATTLAAELQDALGGAELKVEHAEGAGADFVVVGPQ